MTEIYRKNWETLAEFVDEMQREKENDPIGNRRESARYIGDWAGGSWEDAIRLAKEGWKDGIQYLSNVSINEDEIEKHYIETIEKVIDVLGFSPHSPRAAAGDPVCMRRNIKKRKSDRFMTIVSNVAISAGTNRHSLIEYGATVASCVDFLEKNGWRVSLHSAWCSRHSGYIFDMRVNLKDYGDNLDINSILFGLAHPLMSRRLFFRALESIKEAEGAIKKGYGVATAPPAEGDEVIIPGVSAGCSDIIGYILGNNASQMEKSSV